MSQQSVGDSIRSDRGIIHLRESIASSSVSSQSAPVTSPPPSVEVVISNAMRVINLAKQLADGGVWNADGSWPSRSLPTFPAIRTGSQAASTYHDPPHHTRRRRDLIWYTKSFGVSTHLFPMISLTFSFAKADVRVFAISDLAYLMLTSDLVGYRSLVRCISHCTQADQEGYA